MKTQVFFFKVYHADGHGEIMSSALTRPIQIDGALVQRWIDRDVFGSIVTSNEFVTVARWKGQALQHFAESLPVHEMRQLQMAELQTENNCLQTCYYNRLRQHQNANDVLRNLQHVRNRIKDIEAEQDEVDLFGELKE